MNYKTIITRESSKIKWFVTEYPVEPYGDKKKNIQ